MNDSPTDVHAEFWASFTAVQESVRVIETLDDPWDENYQRLQAELDRLDTSVGRARKLAAKGHE